MDNKLEITWDDLPEDIKELVEFGFFTKEEAFERYASCLKMCLNYEMIDFKKLYSLLTKFKGNLFATEFVDDEEAEILYNTILYLIKKHN